MSFGSVQAAQDALQAALEAASAALPVSDQFRVHAEVSDAVDPPAAVLTPPLLLWSGAGTAPTDATWTVAVVVAEGKGTTATDLYRVLPEIAAVIDMETDFVVKQAEPGSWQSGNSTLPCFLLTIEVAL